MLWDIMTARNEDGSFTVVIRFAGVVMIIFTVPIQIGKALSIRYKNAQKGGRVSMVECDVHKTYTENIPMWTFRTMYPKDKDYIVFMLYNEVNIKFTCKLYNDGHLVVSCPTKMRKVPLDDSGNPIKEVNPKPEIIEIPRQEEKIPNFADVVKNINEDVKLRRNSA